MASRRELGPRVFRQQSRRWASCAFIQLSNTSTGLWPHNKRASLHCCWPRRMHPLRTGHREAKRLAHSRTAGEGSQAPRARFLTTVLPCPLPLPPALGTMRCGLLLHLVHVQRSKLRLQARFLDSGATDSWGRMILCGGTILHAGGPRAVGLASPARCLGHAPLQRGQSKVCPDIARCPLGSTAVLGRQAVMWSLQGEPAVEASPRESGTGEPPLPPCCWGPTEVEGWGGALGAS